MEPPPLDPVFGAVYRGSLDEILSGRFLFGVVAATLGTALTGR